MELSAGSIHWGTRLRAREPDILERPVRHSRTRHGLRIFSPTSHPPKAPGIDIGTTGQPRLIATHGHLAYDRRPEDLSDLLTVDAVYDIDGYGLAPSLDSPLNPKQARQSSTNLRNVIIDDHADGKVAVRRWVSPSWQTAQAAPAPAPAPRKTPSPTPTQAGGSNCVESSTRELAGTTTSHTRVDCPTAGWGWRDAPAPPHDKQRPGNRGQLDPRKTLLL